MGVDARLHIFEVLLFPMKIVGADLNTGPAREKTVVALTYQQQLWAVLD
jgi:hypothetical protein